MSFWVLWLVRRRTRFRRQFWALYLILRLERRGLLSDRRWIREVTVCWGVEGPGDLRYH